MPRISAFYGIVILMFWNDHNPPHLHATYGEFEILINLNDFSVYAGQFPSRAFGMLMEWVSIHKEELLSNWDLLQQSLLPKPIEPLK
ncbi:MAG TPA: DUF4160 domain-containing protein [Candidatus Dojkabacteria bacterium]|nr:DUF4160 domain-containing protein [Candidatus Dojkabacteria bacterium]